MLKQIYSSIDRMNQMIGSLVSWLSLLLVLVIVFDVLLRYVFNWSSPLSFELEWHLFSILFLLSAGWTLQRDKHVRVDVFYNSFSQKKKDIVNIFGTVFFLIPLCCVAVIESIPFVINSYQVLEKSNDPGGLPARYLIKSMIPIGFICLGLQGVSMIFRSILNLTHPQDD
ncbi:MAG: TRAP transporter small permease subunit [Cyclobacteriaceae bacterium]